MCAGLPAQHPVAVLADTGGIVQGGKEVRGRWWHLLLEVREFGGGGSSSWGVSGPEWGQDWWCQSML